LPSVESFAHLCIEAGANGLTVHPRPDQRHIRPDDVVALGKIAHEENIVEFNIEGNPFAPPREGYPGLIALVEQTNPDQCTLVPDNDDQKTSDHGFNLTEHMDTLAPIVRHLKSLGTRVSIFTDPDPGQIELAKALGADRIELYTGPFAWAFESRPEKAKQIFDQHCRAATAATDLGLGINAGHDLNLENMVLYKTLPGLLEVSIGHALTVDALFIGFDSAVKEYLSVCG